MPFKIQDDHKELILDASRIVTCDEFVQWSSNHTGRVSRNGRIAGVSLDFDPPFVRFKKQLLLDLIGKNPTPNEFIGILFASEIDHTLGFYKKNNIFICKAIQERDHFNIVGTVYGSAGPVENYATFTEHYKDRIRRLRRNGSADFGHLEMSGIYHQSDLSKPFIESFKTQYLRFSFLMDLEKTTVVISDNRFDPRVPITCIALTPPVLYDHGTGCCTITP